VLAQQDEFVALTPEARAIFALLERHWPRLVNAIESRHIPTTNNTTEEVVRIFTQHYKTFCGFENIESARLYLGVFEKVYRFTPFSADAQHRIRGECPLELAGYDVQKLPMAQLFRGLALHWPASAFQELVPNVRRSPIRDFSSRALCGRIGTRICEHCTVHAQGCRAAMEEG
jgi:hypothetical protein